MASYVLPLRTDLPAYRFQVELEGRTYGLRLRWNERAAAWFLSVLTADDALLLSGVKVVVGVPLLRRHVDSRLPPGELMALDTARADAEAGLEELGARVVLTYTEAADLPEGYRA